MTLIQQLTGLIEGNLNSAMSVKILAERSGYSERWLYNLFKEDAGISVAKYIRRRKLTLSAVLLRHTSLPITDISFMYGFNSLQTFSRSFKQQFKSSPVRYRNADAWDMQYAQPVLYRRTQCTEFKMLEITQGEKKTTVLNKKPIRLGMDFIHIMNKGRFTYNQNLSEAIMSIYISTYAMLDFLISGEMVPAEKTDSELIFYVKEIGEYTNPEKLLSDGLYASQKFKGTYEQLCEFQMYDAMADLCTNKCILKKGPMYTICHRTAKENILTAQFLIPCLKL